MICNTGIGIYIHSYILSNKQKQTQCTQAILQSNIYQLVRRVIVRSHCPDLGWKQIALIWYLRGVWLVPERSGTLTHWGRVTHICVSKLFITGSDNGLSPDRRQAIIWTNVRILFIGPLGTNFSEILIEILTFSFKKMRLKCRLRNGGHVVSASMC